MINFLSVMTIESRKLKLLKEKNVLIAEDMGKCRRITAHLDRLAAPAVPWPPPLRPRAPAGLPSVRGPYRCSCISRTPKPIAGDCGPSRGLDGRPEPSLRLAKPGRRRPRPLAPLPNGRSSASAPPLPGRPRRAGACAVASELPDRDGGRFGVATARGGVGRSGGAVDRVLHPEFRGNRADTPPGPARVCLAREIPPLGSPSSRATSCQPGPSALQLGASAGAARLVAARGEQLAHSPLAASPSG